MGTYTWDHRKQRQNQQKIIDAGYGYCTAPICLKKTRQIIPGAEWDLGHTPDGNSYEGMQHRSCNRADGGRRSWGHGVAAQRTGAQAEPKPQEKRWRPTRIW